VSSLCVLHDIYVNAPAPLGFGSFNGRLIGKALHHLLGQIPSPVAGFVMSTLFLPGSENVEAGLSCSLNK
jgi:hypothetical protein